MSEQVSEQVAQFEGRGEVKVPRPARPSAKIIEAHSRARNSLALIIIAGVLLTALAVAVFVEVAWPKQADHLKDLLVVLGTGIGYLLGSKESLRKEET